MKSVIAVILAGIAVRRSPHGERGLKFFLRSWANPDRPRRSPHGERGLKSALALSHAFERGRVAPLTGSVD